MRLAVHFVHGAAITGVMMMGSIALGADWPNWRGPNHDGISSEEGFTTTWTSSPKVLWDYPVGTGFSAFACVDGRVYTCGTKDKQQVMFCFDAKTGNVIWEQPFEKEHTHRQGGAGTRATPSVHEGRVYQLGAHGRLVCLDAKDGKEIWKKQFNKKPRWAYSSSVLIEGNLAIAIAGGEDGLLLALNKKTGEVVWKCANDTPGYSTPYAFTFKEKRYIFGFAAKAGIIADAKTGREVCRIPWETAYNVNASAPIYHDGHLFLSTGYDTGCALFKLRETGDKLAVDEVWRSKVLMTKFRSPILKDGVLYSGDQKGFRCVEFMTGKELWQVDRMKHASAVLADDHLIILTEKGKVMTAKATPKGFKPIAEAEVLSGRCWTVPTLYAGKLYVRDLKKAVCLDLTPTVTVK